MNIRLTESDLHRIIKESVNRLLTEMDWKTYIEAARKRHDQGQDFQKMFPGAEENPNYRKAYDLERHAQDRFMRAHGKNGHDHNYEGDSPDYLGRTHHPLDDFDFETKNQNYKTWPDDESDTPGHTAELRKYRFGKGIPHIKHGELHDDTFDFIKGHDWTNDQHRRHTTKFTKEGDWYDPWSSSVGNEVSASQDDDYNDRQNRMADDLKNYYSGKSKYTKGTGWK